MQKIVFPHLVLTEGCCSPGSKVQKGNTFFPQYRSAAWLCRWKYTASSQEGLSCSEGTPHRQETFMQRIHHHPWLLSMEIFRNQSHLAYSALNHQWDAKTTKCDPQTADTSTELKVSEFWGNFLIQTWLQIFHIQYLQVKVYSPTKHLSNIN